jgi:acyl-CoA thioesterase I
MRQFKNILFGLLSFSFVAFCYHAPVSAAGNTNNQVQTILVFGDSLSAAYGLSQEQGWAALLAKKLNGFSQTHRINVINASISGETTSGGLSRFQNAITKFKPTIVILELGANDGLRGLPVNLMAENLEVMIKTSQKNNAKVLLLGMRIPPNYGAKYTESFSKTYPTLSQQYKTGLVPFMLDGVAGNPSLIQSDGLHPTAEAQQQILNNIWPYLASMIGIKAIN